MQSNRVAPVSEAKTASAAPSFRGRLRTRLFRLLAMLPNFIFLVVVVLAWQFASKVWIPSIDPHMAVLMPAPTTIAVTAAGVIVSGEVFFHLMGRLKPVVVGIL